MLISGTWYYPIDAVLPTQLLIIVIIPFLIFGILQNIGVVYQKEQALPLVPSIFIDCGDIIFDALSRSSSISFASYFAVARVTMYYLLATFYIIDAVVALRTDLDADDLVSSLEREVGRSAIWIMVLVAPAACVSSVVWGLFTADPLGVSVREPISQGGGNGLWWLYWPCVLSVGLGCLFIFLKSAKYLFSSSRERL